MARPSDYSQATADAICARLADGESLRAICRDDGMPDKSTVFRWLAAHEAFRDQYAHARELQAEEMFEDLLDIADDGTRDTYVDGDGKERTDTDVIARAKLRVDTRKWMLARMAPKKYGDKVTQELTGADGAPITIAVNFVKP